MAYGTAAVPGRDSSTPSTPPGSPANGEAQAGAAVRPRQIGTGLIADDLFEANAFVVSEALAGGFDVVKYFLGDGLAVALGRAPDAD